MAYRPTRILIRISIYNILKKIIKFYSYSKRKSFKTFFNQLTQIVLGYVAILNKTPYILIKIKLNYISTSFYKDINNSFEKKSHSISIIIRVILNNLRIKHTAIIYSSYQNAQNYNFYVVVLRHTIRKLKVIYILH